MESLILISIVIVFVLVKSYSVIKDFAEQNRINRDMDYLKEENLRRLNQLLENRK